MQPNRFVLSVFGFIQNQIRQDVSRLGDTWTDLLLAMVVCKLDPIV